MLVEQREPAIESRLNLEHRVDGGIRALHELTTDTDSHVKDVGRPACPNLVA
jgi:hypothetical protein